MSSATGMYTYPMPETPAPRPADLIFPEARRQDAITLGFCVLPPFGCGLPVEGFKDPLSRKEFGISGMCQNCQDEIFGPGDETW